jgi:hypothetical protein
VSVLACGAEFTDPVGVYPQAGGTWLVADESAEVMGTGCTGAVWSVSEAGEVLLFAASEMFVAPCAVAGWPAGGHLVLDWAADPYGLGSAPGAVFRLPEEGAVEVVSSSSEFALPVGLSSGAQGLLPGDVDGDGDVDLVDFSTFAVCFGCRAGELSLGCPPERLQRCDLDSSGWVNLVDFSTFAANFGRRSAVYRTAR